MAYLIAAVVMTLSVLEDHSSIASLLKYNFSYLWHIAWSLCICRASCFVDMALIITDLPLEVIVHILSFLPITDLLQAAIVCHVFYHAANVTYSRQHHRQLGLLMFIMPP